MRVVALIIGSAILLTGCADQQARDQASAAEEAAASANARAEAAEMHAKELERRVEDLEAAAY